jgi:hypothetical protein
MLMGKPNYLEKWLSQWHFVYHKSHMDWPGIKFKFHSERLVTAGVMAWPDIK